MARRPEFGDEQVVMTPADAKHAWNDQLEAIQFTTKVFQQLRLLEGKVDSDFVLAKLDEKQRAYIIENTKLAILTKRLLPDKTVGERIFDTIITEAFMIAILHRNLDRNTLLDIIGGVRRDEDEKGGGETTMMNELKGLIDKGDKKEKKP